MVNQAERDEDMGTESVKSISIYPVAASGPGALSGYCVDCHACGTSWTVSGPTQARIEADAHIDYHERTGR